MPRLGKPGCPICGRPETVSGTETILTRCGACRTKRVWFDLARSVAPYVGPAGNWIRMLKYGRKRRLGSALGQILAESLRSDPELAPLVEVDYVVPVPLHWLRAWWRGFNQSELLAQSICREWGLESGNGVLRRIRNDRKQVGLSGRRRWENVKGAFVVTRPEEVKGKRILLVDDVMTTGATLSECARVLKKAGAKTVCGLTLTRQVG
jgi:ComF family protein